MVRAVILGSDTLLAARPAAPMQLLHACLRHEYDFAVPVSWGEELLAARAGEWLRRHPDPALIMAHCPFVAEALRTIPSTGATCLAGVAPPVATARYIRQRLAPRTVHIVYAGACPGATGPEIDEVLLPELLLAQLADARIVPAEEPHELDSRLPPERARYASQAGGVPDPDWLWQATGVAEIEVAPLTLAVAPLLAGAERVLLDLNVACGCVCAHDRFAIARLEPPRATAPVLGESVAIDLRDGAPLAVPESGREPWKVVEPETEAPVPAASEAESATAAAAAPPVHEARVAPSPLREPRTATPERAMPEHVAAEQVTPERLTAVVEPWVEEPRLVAPGRATAHPGRASPAPGAVRIPVGGADTGPNGKAPAERAGNESPAPAVHRENRDLGRHP